MFERADDGRNARRDQPLDAILNLTADPYTFVPQGLRRRGGITLPALPLCLEHRDRHRENRLGRFCGSDERLELALDHSAADGFAVPGASLAEAEIVGVLCVTARGPAGGQRLSAIVTHDETTQRKILVDVLPRRRAVDTVQAVLNALMGGKRDQWLVMAATERNAPFFGADQTGISRVAEHVADTLMRNLAVLSLRKKGMRVEETLHVGGRLEVSRRISLQRLNDDGRDGLLADEHAPAVPCGLVIAIADRGAEHGVASAEPRSHSDVGDLLVVDALIVGDRDGHVLDKAGRGVIAVDHVRRFQDAAHFIDHAAQIAVQIGVAAKPVNVIEDNPEAFVRLGAHVIKQVVQPRAAALTSGEIVAESARDFITLAGRVV